MYKKMHKKLTALFVVIALLFGVTDLAAAEAQGFIAMEDGVGYFYGTFGQDPNVQLIVGGSAAEFCADNPDDPFNATPGSAPSRIYLRSDGSVDIKSNDKDQPMYLYLTSIEGGPEWISQVCADIAAGGSGPEAFAVGIANLKVRVSVISEDLIDVYNGVNGTAVAADGTEYKVRAWADVIIENGAPTSDPANFVGFEMHEIKG